MTGIDRHEFPFNPATLAWVPRWVDDSRNTVGAGTGEREDHPGPRRRRRSRQQPGGGFRRARGCQFACICADCDYERHRPLPGDCGETGGTPRGSPGLPQDAGRQIGGRRDRGDAGPLARLATIRACQAGKDVYVEKPPSHNCWEGRKMVEAARKYKRIVQVGTQSRSAPYNMAAKKYIADGKLGKVHFCRIYNQKEWANFTMQPDSEPPDGFDWDRWNGPAPPAKYNATLHRNWHHFWCYSSGDIINDGIHQMDLARVRLGVDFRRPSIPQAPVSSRARPNRPTRRSPSTISTTWS